MHYLANAYTAKKIDQYTINNIGIPSCVLMERAAQCVANVIANESETQKVIAMCGKGNNGGDAIAVARILHDKGFSCTILMTSTDDKLSPESLSQINIARNIGIEIIYSVCNINIDDFDIIIDGLFGIGLSKPIRDEYNSIINIINESDCTVYSIDIPSGINCSDGSVMGNAVNTDVTITFGYNKLGLMLYPGREYAGRVIVVNDVFPNVSYNKIQTTYFCYDRDDINLVPARKSVSNKGTYGHVLVIAGSDNMSGAAFLSAKAAYRTGCGLVKILTHDNNRNILSTQLPEAIISIYCNTDDITDELIIESIKWADSIVIGPGLGMSDESELLVTKVLKHNFRPMVIDADAINIIAKKDMYNKDAAWCNNVVLTPHLKEMSRLINNQFSTEYIHDNILNISKEFIYNDAVLVLKDAVTCTSDGNNVIVNNSGNNGMATAGSGDVLTGIIAALLAQGSDRFTAASLGAYIHGLAGDEAANKCGYYSLMANDIIESLSTVL